MRNVQGAYVRLQVKPTKIVEIGPKTRLGGWLGKPYVVLELPDGTRTGKMHVGDVFSILASFRFTENANGTYTVE